MSLKPIVSVDMCGYATDENLLYFRLEQREGPISTWRKAEYCLMVEALLLGFPAAPEHDWEQINKAHTHITHQGKLMRSPQA